MEPRAGGLLSDAQLPLITSFFLNVRLELGNASVRLLQLMAPSSTLSGLPSSMNVKSPIMTPLNVPVDGGEDRRQGRHQRPTVKAVARVNALTDVGRTGTG